MRILFLTLAIFLCAFTGARANELPASFLGPKAVVKVGADGRHIIEMSGSAQKLDLKKKNGTNNPKTTKIVESTFIKVNPKATYLHHDPGSPTPPPASRIILEDYNIEEGDVIGLRQRGGFAYGPTGDETGTLLFGVFIDGAGNYLYPDEITTAPSVESEPTYPNNEPTDISQDFLIAYRTGVAVQVPPGAIALLLTAGDSAFEDNYDRDENFGVQVDPAFNFSVTQLNVAQTVFINAEGEDLRFPIIEGKPVMARVQVLSHDPIDPETDYVIGVKGVFTPDEDSGRADQLAPMELVGCFKPKDVHLVNDEGDFPPDAEDTIYVNLFQSSGQPNTLVGHLGTFEVEVNPLDGVTGLPAELQCGSEVSFAPEQQFEGDTKSVPYKTEESPNLKFHFFTLSPPCLDGGVCDWGTVGEVGGYLEEESYNARALFPIDPARLQVNSDVGDIISNGTKFVWLRAGWDLLCLAESGDRLQACLWQYVLQNDMKKIRRAGLKGLGINKNFLPEKNQFIGIASNSENGTSYFHHLYESYGYKRGQKGIHVYSIPNTTLVERGLKLGVPHEVTHALRVQYNGDGHFPGFDDAVGFWIDRLNNGLKFENIDYMIEAIKAPNGLETHWTDPGTYNQLRENLKQPDDIGVKRILSNQLFVSAFVNKKGKIFVDEVDLGLQAGLTSGISDYSMNFSAKYPDGSIAFQGSIPFSYKVILEEEEEEVRTHSEEEFGIAVVSSGVPYSSDVLSVEASVPATKRTVGGSVSFFPAVEVLRTGIKNIPPDAFVGANPAKAYESLEGALKKMEAKLKRGQVAAANKIVNGSFRSLLISSVIREPINRGSLDMDQSRLLELADRVSAGLSEMINSYPAYENGLINVVPSKLSLGVNEQFSASIFILVSPAKASGQEFFLKVSLDGVNQKISGSGGVKWSYSAPKLSTGAHAVTAQLYTQNKRLAKALNEALLATERELFNAQRALETETDLEKIAQLQAQVQTLEKKKQDIQEKLVAGRKAVGRAISLNLLSE